MEYYRENQDTIVAEIERSRLERELMLLRIIDEAQRKTSEWQEKELLKSTPSNWAIESAYIESQFLKGTR